MFKALGSVGLILVLAVACYYGLQGYIHHRAETLFLQQVAHYEDGGLSYRRFNHKGNQLFLYGVELDSDGFQTIDKISLRYDPWALLQGAQFEELHLEGVFLSFHSDELSEVRPLALPAFPVRVVKVVNSEFSFLTPQWGTYLFEYETTFEHTDQGYELTGLYKSEQPEVRLSGSFQGQIFPQQESFLNIELEGLQIEKPGMAIMVKRSNGGARIQLNRDNIFASSVNFDLTSGQAVLFGFPWSNANFSFNFDGVDSLLSASGKAPSDPGTEFTYSYQRFRDKESEISARLYSKDGESLYTYLNRSNIFILDPDDQPHLFHMKSVEIPFEVFPEKRQFLYYLSEDGEKDESLKREVFY